MGCEDERKAQQDEEGGVIAAPRVDEEALEDDEGQDEEYHELEAEEEVLEHQGLPDELCWSRRDGRG